MYAVYSRAASKAASAAKEAAEDVGRTIDDSRRMWSEIGGTADDAADIAADAARAQHRALSAASAAAESAPRSTDDNIDALIRDVFGYGDAQTKGITEELAEDLPNAGARGRMELEGGADYGRQIQAQAEELRRGDGVVYGDPAGGNRKQYTANDGRGTESLLRKYAETQESFERRVSEVAGSSGGTYEGKRYVLDQHGSGRIAYRLPDAVDPASPAGKAAQAFEENGIRVVVTDGPFESNLNGLTTRHADAVTAPDGTIYLASSASIDPEHIVPHESVHVLKRTGNSAYDDFYDAMYSHMRYNTPEYNAVADKINQAHYNGRYDINDPDSFDSLFTELSAYIHEFLETDPAYARQLFSGMFDDWDAIVAADRALTDALAGLSRRGKSAARSADDNIDAIIRDVFGYGDAQKKGITEELTEDLLNADASDRIDFYADSRGKLLPAAYKEWLGTSKRDELLGSVNHPKLKKAIDELYRPGSIIGDGGTADIIRFENATGILMSRAGHIQKGIDMTRYLQSFIDEKNLTTDEKRLAQEIIKNLRDALEELPK